MIRFISVDIEWRDLWMEEENYIENIRIKNNGGRTNGA
jgi:hypothetical protein